MTTCESCCYHQATARARFHDDADSTFSVCERCSVAASGFGATVLALLEGEA